MTSWELLNILYPPRFPSYQEFINKWTIKMNDENDRIPVRTTQIEVKGVPIPLTSIYANKIPFQEWFFSTGPSTHIESPNSIWVRLTNFKYFNVSAQFYLELTHEEDKVYWRNYRAISTVKIEVF